MTRHGLTWAHARGYVDWARFWVAARARAKLGLGLLRVRVSGSGGSTYERQYFGRHGIYVRIGYRLSSLDMGTCARICRLIGRDSGSWRRHEHN